jgi:hypothetical protein
MPQQGAAPPRDLLVYRAIHPNYVSHDTAGKPVMSDGAFRSDWVSVFRSDRKSARDVQALHPGWGLAQITVGEIESAGCEVRTDEPPDGHLVICRRDKPGNRISSGAAATMSRAAKLIAEPGATP